MSEHRAKVQWQRSGEFRYETYSRSHSIEFGNGLRIAGNAARENIPGTVPPASGVDPEQAFVASLSACHMLWFLHLACQKNFVIERYTDEAVGVLDKTWMSKVTLRPLVAFAGKEPSAAEHAALHERAHEKCFIANSVKTEVTVEPRIV
jgi:organic hydroperoxide reductase OsmC/OhrA